MVLRSRDESQHPSRATKPRFGCRADPGRNDAEFERSPGTSTRESMEKGVRGRTLFSTVRVKKGRPYPKKTHLPQFSLIVSI